MAHVEGSRLSKSLATPGGNALSHYPSSQNKLSSGPAVSIKRENQCLQVAERLIVQAKMLQECFSFPVGELPIRVQLAIHPLSVLLVSGPQHPLS